MEYCRPVGKSLGEIRSGDGPAEQRKDHKPAGIDEDVDPRHPADTPGMLHVVLLNFEKINGAA
jgi:hypothetical protein